MGKPPASRRTTVYHNERNETIQIGMYCSAGATAFAAACALVAPARITAVRQTNEGPQFITSVMVEDAVIDEEVVSVPVIVSVYEPFAATLLDEEDGEEEEPLLAQPASAPPMAARSNSA